MKIAQFILSLLILILITLNAFTIRSYKQDILSLENEISIQERDIDNLSENLDELILTVECLKDGGKIVYEVRSITKEAIGEKLCLKNGEYYGVTQELFVRFWKLLK